MPTKSSKECRIFLNAVTGKTDTILVLRELPNGEIKGSFRSVKRDIAKLAKLLGGGGHKKAAGFTVKGRIEVTNQGPKIIV
jgi:phosphoesterase RecJ-like protein